MKLQGISIMDLILPINCIDLNLGFIKYYYSKHLYSWDIQYYGLEIVRLAKNTDSTLTFKLVLQCTCTAWVTYLEKKRNANSKDCPKMHYAIKFENDSNQISGNGSFIRPFILNAISRNKYFLTW